MEQLKKTKERCTLCNVPKQLHGTMCGWQNAGFIINPITEEAKAYMRERDNAVNIMPNSIDSRVFKLTHDNFTGIGSKTPWLIEIK